MDKNKFKNKYLENTQLGDDNQTDYLMKEILNFLYILKVQKQGNEMMLILNTSQILLNELLTYSLERDEYNLVINSDRTNPEYYKKGGFETIDLIKDIIEDYPDMFLGYLVSNIIKYIMRFQYKGRPEEDLKKAIWYINKAAERAKGLIIKQHRIM